MASVIDTIRTVLGFKHSIIKIAIVSSLFAFPLYMMTSDFQGWLSPWAWASYAILIFYLGYIVLSSHNLIVEKETVLPSFINPFKIILTGLGSVLALGPMVATMGFVGFCLYQILVLYEFDFVSTVSIVTVVELILFGVLMIQMTLFATKLNPLEAYNVIKIGKTFFDFVFRIVHLGIVLGIFTALLLYPLGYLAYQMFDVQSLPFFLFIALLGTFIIIVIFLYYSQMAMENIVLTQKIDYTTDSSSVLDSSLLIDNDKKF